MTNTWWIGALMGLGVRHYLNKEWTPSTQNNIKSRKQIIDDLRQSSKLKELSKSIEKLEIETGDFLDVQMKAAEKTVNVFFKAIDQPDENYYLNSFSKYTVNRIGKESLISYISKIQKRYGQLVTREGPIHKRIQKDS